MTGRLQGKTAFLTAAGQGIGRATALAFAREGAQVVASDVNQATLNTLADESAAITTLTLDVRDSQAVRATAQAVIADHGAPDILFNCAGYVHQGTILECSEEDWDFSFDLNVKSMYRLIRAFLPAIVESGGGAIVNMASVVSSMKGLPNRVAYGTTKAAVIGLTKAVAADTVSQGIRCNAIAPGTVDTPSLGDRIRALGDEEQTRRAFVARQPVGRLGTAGEIAAMAVYLASDEAAFITGQAFAIDGGISL